MLKIDFAKYAKGDAESFAKADEMPRHGEPSDRQVPKAKGHIQELLADVPDESTLRQSALSGAVPFSKR